MPILIDGHNVIAALPDVHLEDEHDEVALIIKLRSWAARHRRKVIVVFDRGIPGGYSPQLSSPDVRIVFAAAHHTNADRIIRERVNKLPDPANWTVVSSDYAVLNQAQDAGAKTMTAHVFADLLNQPMVAEQEKPQTVSQAEIDGWLQVFTDSEELSVPPPPAAAQATGSGIRAPERPAAHPVPPVQPVTQSPRGHTARSIAEQMGMPQPSQELLATSRDKPDEPSPQEVDAWLQVFHDLPESEVPKPIVRIRRSQPSRPVPPPVRKEGELSSDEVDAWMQEFSSGSPPRDEEPSQRPAQAKAQNRLARKKNTLIGADSADEQPSSLSKEDRELWRRLFGKGS